MKYYKWTVKTFSGVTDFLPVKVDNTDSKEITKIKYTQA